MTHAATSGATAARAGWAVPAWVLVALAVAAGLYGRFHGLGERLVAVDEYYFLASVRNVLQEGFPAFPGGGYYTRGLLPQYLTALSIALLGDDGLGWRLPAAVCGCASAVLLFVYAHPRVGHWLAVVLACVLLVSSWEIEFSRFARMYAPFQLATLLFLVVCDRTLLGDHWERRYLAHAAALCVVLTHTEGVVLLPLLFVPLAFGRELLLSVAGRVRYAAVTAATVLAGAAYATIRWRLLGVRDPYPAGFTPHSGPTLRLPEAPFWGSGEASLAGLAVLLGGLAVGGAIAWIIGARRGRPHPSALLSGVFLAAMALHTFVAAVVCAAVLTARFPPGDAAGRRSRQAVLLAGASLGLGWLVFAILTPDWVSRVGDGGHSLAGALQRTFFGWPDLYTAVVSPWARELPGVGLAIGAAVLQQLWQLRRQPPIELALSPAVLLAWVCLALGVLGSPYTTSRYFYFVYPVGLVAVAVSVRQVMLWAGGRWVFFARLPADGLAAIVCVGLFAASTDFNPRHIASVGSAEVALRMGTFERFAPTWYWRLDTESPASFVAREIERDAKARVIVSGQPVISHYLAADHAVFYARDDPRFARVSREGGRRELWSQRPLLSTPDEVRNYTADATRVWLIRAARTDRQWLDVEAVWGPRLRRLERAFAGRDGHIEVVALDLAPGIPAAPSAARGAATDVH